MLVLKLQSFNFLGVATLRLHAGEAWGLYGRGGISVRGMRRQGGSTRGGSGATTPQCSSGAHLLSYLTQRQPTDPTRYSKFYILD